MFFLQIQKERDDLYSKFVKAIHEVQQKTGFKNLLLEKKLTALADSLEKKEAQLNEVLSASNLDPSALTMVTRKLEVCSTKWYNPHLDKTTTLIDLLQCVDFGPDYCSTIKELLF